jgi:hypothetical protein
MPGNNTYGVAVNTLLEQRARLLTERETVSAEIEALDKAIAILSGTSYEPQAAAPASTPSAPTYAEPQGKYSTISLRWACLWILSEAPEIGLTSATVTELLVKGGRVSKADRFASTVSAVLSNLKLKKEADLNGSYWSLTEHGHNALKVIMPRLKFVEQHSVD